MPDRPLKPRPSPPDVAPPTSDSLALGVAALADRLGSLLGEAVLGAGVREFLTRISGEQRSAPPRATDPLARLTKILGLTALDVDLLLLAGLADEHEGFASLLARLHPRGRPHATVALAAQLLAPSPGERAALHQRLHDSPLLSHGLLRLGKLGPLPTRSLLLAPALWPALHGVDAWPTSLERDPRPLVVDGLEEWAQGPQAALALATVQRGEATTLLVHADDEQLASDRAAALVRLAGRVPLRVHLSEKTADLAPLACAHALVRDQVPVLTLAAPAGPGRLPLPDPPHPGPLVIAARTGTSPAPGARRPQISLACTRLSASALRRMWTQALPALAHEAPALAARYPVEPTTLQALVRGLAQQSAALARPITIDDVTAWMRASGGAPPGSGVQQIHPTASWAHLVLPRERLAALRDAVARVRLQTRVLDDWGFLADRRGARGVRMLFCGPPGTGKTLAAEVLAGALATDLLVIDVSQVVSKWIGETEKNLAGVFDAGERTRAVLLFDEADALFGKRTEVSDAHDRYANLETAYLLSRLERYEGLVILTSNLRQNIDPAFMRRMEFVVEFEVPGRDERAALWRCHIPASAPLAPDVSLPELASLYPVVGGVIRNAAVAAAFLAAADDAPIDRGHLVRALRREYEKAGKAFPGASRPPHDP